MRAIPLMGMVVESIMFSQFIVFKTVPFHKMAEIDRIEFFYILRFGSLKEMQVFHA